MPSHEQYVAELWAKQQIREALLRYLRGIDRCDAELIRSAFHPDAIDEHAGSVWTGLDVGEKIVASVRKNFQGTLHVMGNQLIELDGEVAHSETYMVCYLHGADDAGEYILTRPIRYIDQFELRQGEWKVIFRRTIREWDRIDRITERPPHRPYFDPSRTRDDLSYLRPLKPVAADV